MSNDIPLLMTGFNHYLFDGDIDFAEKMLEYGININGQGVQGDFAMSAAIESDKPAVLSFIISKGADVNIDIGNGWRPLHLAFDYAIDGMIQNNMDEPYEEALEMIDILLKNGANISIKNLEGNTALDSLNTYSSDIKSFNSLKEMFRKIIPDIDNKIQYNKINV